MLYGHCTIVTTDSDPCVGGEDCCQGGKLLSDSSVSMELHEGRMLVSVMHGGSSHDAY